VVFARKGIEVIEGSVFNNEEGYFTLAVYNVQGNKILIAAVYGPPDASDNRASNIFAQFFDKIKEIAQVFGTQQIIAAGDWNLHLDTEIRKPRACRIVRQNIEELGLIDLGEDRKEFTWTRRGRNRAKSRLDYIMVTDCFDNAKLNVSWSGLDHASLTADLSRGEAKQKHVLKDWVLNTSEFKEKARKIISDTLLDHVKEYRVTGLAGRAEQNRDRDPSQFEREINVSDKEEGITNAHVLMVIISRLVSLQRRIQIQKSNERKRN
jgi:hypothetical protein